MTWSDRRRGAANRNRTAAAPREQHHQFAFAFVALNRYAITGLLADALDALAFTGLNRHQTRQALLVTDAPECAATLFGPPSRLVRTEPDSLNDRNESQGWLWGRATHGGLRVSVVQVPCAHHAYLGGIHKTRVWQHARTAGLSPHVLIYLDIDVLAVNTVEPLLRHLAAQAAAGPPPALAFFQNRIGGEERSHVPVRSGGLVATWAGSGEVCLARWGEAMRSRWRKSGAGTSALQWYDLVGYDRDDAKLLGTLQCDCGMLELGRAPRLLDSPYDGAPSLRSADWLNASEVRLHGLAFYSGASWARDLASEGGAAVDAYHDALRRDGAPFVHFTANDALAPPRAGSGLWTWGRLQPELVEQLWSRLGFGRLGGPYGLACAAHATCSKARRTDSEGAGSSGMGRGGPRRAQPELLTAPEVLAAPARRPSEVQLPMSALEVQLQRLRRAQLEASDSEVAEAPQRSAFSNRRSHEADEDDFMGAIGAVRVLKSTIRS